MPNVKPTTLTTDPPGHEGELSICDGFALFPWLGEARAQVDIKGATGVFFDKTLNFELLRVGLDATHTVFLGVCGPGYAVEADTKESTKYDIVTPGQPSKGTLALAEHRIRGGFQIGADAQITLGFELQVNLIFTKKTLVSADANIDLDVIRLLSDLLETLLGIQPTGEDKEGNEMEMSTFASNEDGSAENEEGHGSPDSAGGENKTPGKPKPNFSGFGMIDALSNPWLVPPGSGYDRAPTATITPEAAINLDIISLLKDIPYLDAIYGLEEALHKTHLGSFEFGPGISIGLPTIVTLKGATIANHPFEITHSKLATEDVSEFELEERSPVDPHLQPLGQTADEIGLLLEHKVGFQIGVYLFAEFTFLKVCHIGARTGDLPVIRTDLPGNLGGPFENHLSFVPGGGTVPFAAPTAAPVVARYKENQPFGHWVNGRLAQYAVSYFNDEYETELGPYGPQPPDELARFFALGSLTDIPRASSSKVTGRRIYRKFTDEPAPTLVGEIANNTTETFQDEVP